MLQRMWEAGSPHAPSKRSGRSDADRLEEGLKTLDLREPRGRLLADRYVELVVAFDRAARWNLKLHYVLRVIAAVAGVLAPALLALDLQEGRASPTRWIAFGLTLLAAIAVSGDHLFGLGERWRHHRRVAEALKREGWFFIQRAGPYGDDPPDTELTQFVERVEALAEEQLTQYLTEVAALRDQPDAGPGAHLAP